PDLHAAVAEMIEDADLLDQPQGRIKRQQIDQRPEPYALGRARHRAEIDAGHRHHVERRSVVLGDVQAVDAGLGGGLDEGEPLVEERRERACAVLDVIEKSDFHGSSMELRHYQWISGSGICPLPARKSKSQPSSAWPIWVVNMAP